MVSDQGGQAVLFNSYIFILFFFPLCLIGYFGLNHCHREGLSQVFLLLMNLWFYGYFHVGYLAIMVCSILINYLFTMAMGKTRAPGLRKAELILAVLLNLGILFYYKYFNFFLSHVNGLFGTQLTLRTIVLPLGISFFTFQQISYVVDSYRGEVRRYPFLLYASFVSYFPQLVAGPIVTHDELIPQFLDPARKRFDWENFSRGLYLFVLGLSKKVLIADTFGRAVSWGYRDIAALNTTNALLVTLAYTFQIYFDFSGYSDMAVGLGKMMNIDLPENFRSPYKSHSITEFWKRWHITLTRFLTKYIYIPLGGSRRGTARTYRNVLIVFLASGIWHGANDTFLLWGLAHGVMSVLERMGKGRLPKLPKLLSWALTFCLLNLSWVLFRADSVADAGAMYAALFRFDFGPVQAELVNAFLTPEIRLLGGLPLLGGLLSLPGVLLSLVYFGGLALAAVPRNAWEHMQSFRPRWQNLAATGLLLGLCVLSFSGVSTFLYFNF